MALCSHVPDCYFLPSLPPYTLGIHNAHASNPLRSPLAKQCPCPPHSPPGVVKIWRPAALAPLLACHPCCSAGQTPHTSDKQTWLALPAAITTTAPPPPTLTILSTPTPGSPSPLTLLPPPLLPFTAAAALLGAPLLPLLPPLCRPRTAATQSCQWLPVAASSSGSSASRRPLVVLLAGHEAAVVQLPF